MAIDALVRLAVDALEDLGITPPEDFRRLLAKRIIGRFGGTRPYLRATILDRETRDALIRSEFSGRNLHQVARKFQVSARTVYRAINPPRK